MVASNTLLVRHMPSELSPEEIEQFMRHFGATNVKVLGSKNKKSNTVYALFDTHEEAETILKHLHQTNVLGELLSVEFARSDLVCNFSGTNSLHNENRISNDGDQKKTQKYYDNFLTRLNSWTLGLDFNTPPPIHLKYLYPPPTRPVLENILKALATEPKFYTQVLHLMNKMNLPCPFVENFPIETTILSPKAELVEDEDYLEEKITMKSSDAQNSSSEDESEIESENDEIKSELIVPSKRQRPSKKHAVKRPKFVIKPPMTNVNKSKTTSNKLMSTTEVFEKPNDQPQTRKIQVNITQDLSSIKEAEKTQKSICAVEGFEKLKMNETSSVEGSKSPKCTEEDENDGSCITEQELASNRISVRDQRILPVFKNYQPGVPSCRLYIKNLAKQVASKDLHYIYRRYHLSHLEEDQGTMFDVRLMQEGRMKGQAFVNLQNVEIAQKALKETNGFILKDKPMVVQFARSSKAKE